MRGHSDGFLLLYDLNIARETAARARNESQAEPEEHGSIRVRSGLRDVDTCTLDRSRPVPSKLINSLFGVKHPREAHRLQMQRSRTIEGGPVPLRLGSAKFARPIPLSRPSVQLSAEEIEMNRKRLVGSLKCNGSYPEKYRVLVWRFLLRLPKNEEAFRLLVAKGKHPVFVRLKDQYPLHCDRLFRHFHRILSAMVFWCPAFGELDYLPAIVYPFVKIFRENDLVAFEASLSVMLHWCGDFLVSFPHPPVFAMEAFEKELSRRDAQLLNHLTQFQVTSEVYAWSLLKTIFTEVLSEDEWLCLWDHLLTYSDTPQLLFVAVLAYLSYFRVALLAACDRFSIEHFFHQENAIHMKKFIQLMMIIRDELDLSTFTALKDPHADASSAPSTSPYWPLSRGQYPAFAHYPRGVLDAHVHASRLVVFQDAVNVSNPLERNRVALEEAELIQKQQCLNQVKHTSDKLQAEHDKWIKERKRLLRAQERRQNEAIAAEKERLQHLKTLDYETYKQRLEYLNHVKTSAREMLEEAAKWFQVECRRLENTLAMHKERMTLELLSRKHEEDVQRMEAEVHDRVQDIFKHCQIEERLASLRTEFESRAAQQSFEMKATMERWKKEHAEQAREATIQLHQGEDHARRRHEDRLPQTLDQKLSEQQREKKAMIKLDNAQHGRRQEREEWASSHHEVDTHRDAVMVQEERNARVGGLTQERDDNTLPPHYSRESLSQGADSNDVSRRRDNDVTDHDHVSNTVVEKPLQRSNARAGEAIDSNVCDASLLPANVSHKLEPEPRSSENDKRSTSPQSSPQTLQDCSTVEKQDTTRTRQMMHKVSLVHNNVDLITSENVGLARPAKGKGASLSGTAQPNEATSMPRQPLDMWPVQKKDVPSTDRLKPYELKLEDERQSCLTLDFARRSREEPFLAPPARRQESSAEATVSSSCRNAVRRASTRTEYARYLRDDDDDARSPKSDAVLQRPLAELEQKLGVRFDDLSDDDESSEEEDGTLLERAQRLLALSPLDLDSADDL
ncbi:hypothetical protein PsorP6_000850 [Peronosclerospora sorghi]|uniref:Uncharacterized protein n=1 Tax=Peronosclerospora sorghi TaxID=230839 RepID=A0ACC0WWZ0_9STRA|nr:hypothetical protein PsorP6_000850 [Peronosclerospora sorghi]